MKPWGRKTLKARASMSGYSSNVKPYGGIHLRVTDDSSGTMVIELDFTYEQMGQMMAGHGETPCEMELFNSFERAGKVHEHQVIKIPIKTDQSRAFDYLKGRIIKAQAAIAPDGWEADMPTSWNSHDYKDGKYSVIFRRYVDKEDSNG